jgi:hypothetical protein
MVIRYGYCPQHAPWISQHNARALRTACILASVPLLLTGVILAGEGWPALGLAMLAALGAVVVAAFALTLWTTRIGGAAVHHGHAWLTGFGHGYLALFPAYQEAVENDLARTAEALDHLTD